MQKKKKPLMYTITRKGYFFYLKKGGMGKEYFNYFLFYIFFLFFFTFLTMFIDISSIPNNLTILPLHNQVLLPSIITHYVLSKSESDKLLLQRTPEYIVCIPLIEDNLFHFGCVGKVLEFDKTLPDRHVLKVQGVCRSRIQNVTSVDGGNSFQVELSHYFDGDNIEIIDDFIDVCYSFVNKMKSIGVSISVLNQFCQAIKRYPISHVANLLLCLTECSIHEKLHALEIIDLTERLTNIRNTVTRYLQVNKNNFGIHMH